jgi:hypothetical protein
LKVICDGLPAPDQAEIAAKGDSLPEVREARWLPRALQDLSQEIEIATVTVAGGVGQSARFLWIHVRRRFVIMPRIERDREIASRRHRRAKLKKLEFKALKATGADRDAIVEKVRRMSPLYNFAGRIAELEAAKK